jgi:hypothetical protein
VQISAFLNSREGLLKCASFKSADFQMSPSDISLNLNFFLSIAKFYLVTTNDQDLANLIALYHGIYTGIHHLSFIPPYATVIALDSTLGPAPDSMLQLLHPIAWHSTTE